jgi:isopentenyl-diphosphate delta-isomerase
LRNGSAREALRTDAEEERVVLVDPEGRDLLAADGSLRTQGKTEAHRLGSRHRAVSVFVFDGERCCCSAARSRSTTRPACGRTRAARSRAPGEAPAAAAARRRRRDGRELRARRALAVRLLRAGGGGLVEHEFDHVFAGEWRGTPVPLAAEVAEWRWLPAARARRRDRARAGALHLLGCAIASAACSRRGRAEPDLSGAANRFEVRQADAPDARGTTRAAGNAEPAPDQGRS